MVPHYITNHTTTMKRLFIALALGIALVSCGTRPEPKASNRKKVAVQRVFYSTHDGYRPLDSVLTIKYVDTLYGVGDIVQLGDATYRIAKD